MSDKKGEITTLMRTILILVVLVLAVFLAWKGIASIKEAQDETKLVKFKAKIESETASFARSPGSRDTILFGLPDYVSKVCLVNTDKSDQLLLNEPYNTARFDDPLIKDSLQSNADSNVFLYDSDGTILESFNTGRIWPNACPPYECHDILGGRLELSFEGRNGFAILSNPLEPDNTCNPQAPAPLNSACAANNLDATQRENEFCFSKYCYEIYIQNSMPGMENTIVSIKSLNRAHIDKTKFGKTQYEVYMEDYYDFDCDDFRFSVTADDDSVALNCIDTNTSAFNKVYLRITATDLFKVDNVTITHQPANGPISYDKNQAKAGILLYNSTFEACTAPSLIKAQVSASPDN